jgi:cyclopropane fatty-acyl-phospholipid synthase-like methyltransferase
LNFLIKKFGANVLGIDLSNNMVNIALERAASEADIKDKVGCHIYGSSTLL